MMKLHRLILFPLLIMSAAINSQADQKLAGQDVLILTELKPLSIRGTNYFPRDTPWDGAWIETSNEIIRADLDLAASLEINTLRIFLPWNENMEAAGLIDLSGNPAPEFLEKFEFFLAEAWKRGIRAIVCFNFEYRVQKPSIPENWRAAMEAFAVPHRDDGRILMWDLMNEPERLAWSPETMDYLRDSMIAIKEFDPNHLTTVGIGYQIEHLVPAGLPDVLQYHDYAPYDGLVTEGFQLPARTMKHLQEVGDYRPLIVGEFGSPTAAEPGFGVGMEWTTSLGDPSVAATEAEQLLRYAFVFGAAEDRQIAGVLSWCLYDYPPQEEGFLVPTGALFGMVRLDGTLKPSAILTRETFRRWSARESNELVKNGGFESEIEVWNLSDNFERFATIDARGGTHVLRVGDNFPAGGWPNSNQVIQLGAASWGHSFSASVWAFSPSDNPLTGGDAGLKIEFRDSNNDTLHSHETYMLNADSATATWFEGTAEGLVPEGAKTVSVQLMFAHPDSTRGSIYFDDASFKTSVSWTEKALNGSFEYGGEHWSFPEHFEPYKTLDALSGDYVLRVQDNFPDSGYPNAQQFIPVNASSWGSAFSASFFAYSPSSDPLTGGDARIKVEFLDADSQILADSHTPVIGGSSPTDTWIKQVINGTVPEGTTTVAFQVMFYLPDGTRGSFYVDDVSFLMPSGTVIPSKSYEGWLEEAFPNPEDRENLAISGTTVDTRGEGVPNLMRYALAGC